LVVLVKLSLLAKQCGLKGYYVTGPPLLNGGCIVHHYSGLSSPKWPILCRVGRQTLLYHTYHMGADILGVLNFNQWL